MKSIIVLNNTCEEFQDPFYKSLPVKSDLHVCMFTFSVFNLRGQVYLNFSTELFAPLHFQEAYEN